MTNQITSASGLLSLLDEAQPELQTYALGTLNSIIDQFWTEISESVAKIEALYEDESFEQRQLAALLVSKIYYYLGEFDDSLSFALGANELYDPKEKSVYVQTILSKAVDRYIEQRKANEQVDPRLISIIEVMFNNCWEEQEYKEAIGIAIECRRLDIVKEAIYKGKTNELLDYVLDVGLRLIEDKDFRVETIKFMVEMYKSFPERDYLSIGQCYIFLEDVEGCFELIEQLLDADAKDEEYDWYLQTLQICFDIEGSASQMFKKTILEKIHQVLQREEGTNKDNQLLDLTTVLKGDFPTALRIKFLSSCNNTDLGILKNTRTSLDSRNSLYHSAVTFANAFMNAGTTSDRFLRQNLEWLSRASNWSKFSATAALGVLHKGNIKNWNSVLSPYLPNETTPGSPYSEGGSLFAMGLIHANHYSEELDYILKILQNSQDEIIQHGAALGLGVSAMGTDNETYYNELKQVLFTDSAVAGEAAGVAMGLIKLGTGITSQAAIEEMLRYAQETQHEKIIRGISIGIALIMYGTEDKAEPLIDRLMADQDHIIRYGAMYTIALAYAGTGSNVAIKKLLHVAVSDVNDDVRRAAVTALGFIMFKEPKKVPRAVQLLSESYNPHVRYGAAIALGIACSGTGLNEALVILDPLVRDSTDFVRQGALIALAMICCQHNEVSNPRSATARKLFERIISDKHESAMAKFGAALAQGLIDAGGRNVRISLDNDMGLNNMSAIAGMAIFTQFWYWHPFAHFASLAFVPTTLIGITGNMKVPKFEFYSKAKPSLFAYPPKVKDPEPETVEKVATAVLSTSAKSKARSKKKREALEQEENEIKEEEEKAATITETEKVEVKEAEPTFETLTNITRILPRQEKYLEYFENSRYYPLKDERTSGIVVLADEHPDQEDEYLYPEEEKEIEVEKIEPTPEQSTNSSNNNTTTQENKDPVPPGGFDFDFDQHQ